MVLDGVLPTYLDQLEVTRGQAEEFEILLRYFIEDCLSRDDCPVAGTVDQGVKQLQEFLMKLDQQPLVGAEGRELTQAVAEYAILSYLYFPEYDFDELRPALNAAMTKGDPESLFTILDQRISRGPDGKYEDNSNDSFYAVSCLDLPVSQSFDQIREFAQDLERTAPTFGRSLAWGATVCKDWPFQGIQPPAIQQGTTPPVMIVVTENDPATPARWGKDLAQKLGNAEVVEWVGGYNHTAYNEGSSCVTDAVDAFLLDGAISSGSTLACD
jgi:pimeloyl-ACP methyl ester carboxylesterase